ncbi:MAG: hypothetical protein HY344_00005 [Candidatus Levybacteria bacterium]|nr:hypothetical protein [Candidatus Levybacteria bacterium]
MGSLDESLRRTYGNQSHVTPERFGNHFNPAPKRDALGRRPATPLEVEKAVQGEFAPSLPPSANASRYLSKREQRFARKRGRGG